MAVFHFRYDNESCMGIYYLGVCFFFTCSEAPLPSIKFPVRQLGDAEQWGPTLQVLSDAEMEKKMRDQDRNTRWVGREGSTGSSQEVIICMVVLHSIHTVFPGL